MGGKPRDGRLLRCDGSTGSKQTSRVAGPRIDGMWVSPASWIWAMKAGSILRRQKEGPR